MEKKSSFELSFVLPVILGALSLIGIAVVLLVDRNNQRKPVELAATETPFKYIYLGTEPGLSTLTPEVTDTPEVIDTPILPPPIVLETSITVVLPTQPAFRTATPTSSPTLASILSKIDDTYFELLYDGNWNAQSNVSDTYQNTLHISFEVGNSVDFTFVGEQIIVSYQVGPSLGSISITLDDEELPPLSQLNVNKTEIVYWYSKVLKRGTHTIHIEHLSGGSVNLDSITIPDLSTPTPTVTPTP